ncbi:DUF3941 domain-containing protein [Bacillus sp. FJAT-45037]|nr:DUF3941 domain-containing protein [Bacillus sp. FJAT-45037]
MSHTGDANKKKKDSNAINAQKNRQVEKNAYQGKHADSKEPDHL